MAQPGHASDERPAERTEPMGRVKSLSIQNYRSIGENILINFPENVPLVPVGENNLGKSNIVRSLDLRLREMWPGSHEPEDHEYHGRDKGNSSIEIVAEVEGVTVADWQRKRNVARFIWRYPSGDDRGPFRIGFQGGEERPFVSNDTREQCTCISVGADRRLSYQLSYSSKYTLLAKLMRKFHQSLTSDSTRVEKLKDRYSEIMSLFQSVDQFRDFTRMLHEQVDELSGNLEYGLASTSPLTIPPTTSTPCASIHTRATRSVRSRSLVQGRSRSRLSASPTPTPARRRMMPPQPRRVGQSGSWSIEPVFRSAPIRR